MKTPAKHRQILQTHTKNIRTNEQTSTHQTLPMHTQNDKQNNTRINYQ